MPNEKPRTLRIPWATVIRALNEAINEYEIESDTPIPHDAYRYGDFGGLTFEWVAPSPACATVTP